MLKFYVECSDVWTLLLHYLSLIICFPQKTDFFIIWNCFCCQTRFIKNKCTWLKFELYWQKGDYEKTGLQLMKNEI